jgi:dTDP-glucose pyrophosphorylase
MQVVILAGGRGTRAYPYTEYLPKPMMPVCGKPILARVMEIFAAQGHLDFIISVGYRRVLSNFATPFELACQYSIPERTPILADASANARIF